jgi:hypothetical protein
MPLFPEDPSAKGKVDLLRDGNLVRTVTLSVSPDSETPDDRYIRYLRTLGTIETLGLRPSPEPAKAALHQKALQNLLGLARVEIETAQAAQSTAVRIGAKNGQAIELNADALRILDRVVAGAQEPVVPLAPGSEGRALSTQALTASDVVTSVAIATVAVLVLPELAVVSAIALGAGVDLALVGLNANLTIATANPSGDANVAAVEEAVGSLGPTLSSEASAVAAVTSAGTNSPLQPYAQEAKNGVNDLQSGSNTTGCGGNPWMSAGDCCAGQLCSAVNTCIRDCNGVTGCFSNGSTCCGPRLCGPTETCLTCGTSPPTCAPKESRCCGFSYCRSTESCSVCGGVPMCTDTCPSDGGAPDAAGMMDAASGEGGAKPRDPGDEPAKTCFSAKECGGNNICVALPYARVCCEDKGSADGMPQAPLGLCPAGYSVSSAFSDTASNSYAGKHWYCYCGPSDCGYEIRNPTQRACNPPPPKPMMPDPTP